MMNRAAYDNLRSNQRQLDADGVEVAVSRQALDQVLDSYEAAAAPNAAIMLAIAEALDCYWNAAIGAAHDRGGFETMSIATVTVTGISAIATRLRELAADQKPDQIERRIYHGAEGYDAYLKARFGVSGHSFSLDDGHRWAYRYTAFDDQGDYDLLWRPSS